jgi:hypothetical protein
MKRYIFAALLTALGWLGTSNSVQAQTYYQTSYTYDPVTGAYVQTMTPANVVQAGNVTVSWTPRGYYTPGVVYTSSYYPTYYYPNSAYYYRPYRFWYRGW